MPLLLAMPSLDQLLSPLLLGRMLINAFGSWAGVPPLYVVGPVALVGAVGALWAYRRARRTAMPSRRVSSGT
jgi:hypothetical protein